MDLRIKNNRDFYQKTLHIAIPVTISNFVSSALHLVDNVMIGQLDASHISAAGLANQMTFVLMLLFFGINSGTSIFIAQFWGKKDTEKIKKVLAVSLLFSGIASILFFVIAFFGTDKVLSMMTKDPHVRELGVTYLKTVAPSFFLIALVFPLTFATRSIGLAKLGMYASGVSILTNTLLNYLLIFGKFGFPMLGIKGAAIATVLARMLEAGLLLLYIYRHLPILQIRICDFYTIPKKLLRDILKKAVPVILNEGFWSTGIATMTFIYARISTEASAAIFVCETIRMLFTAIAFGIGNSAAVLIGNTLGEGNKKLAIEYNAKYLVLSLLVGALMGLLIALSAKFIVTNFYNLTPETAALTISAVYMTSLIFPFKFYNLTMIVGTFRAGGDTVFSMLLEAVSVWLVAVPATYLAGLIFCLPLPLVVIISKSDEFFKFFVGLPRVLSGKWANILTD